VLAVAKEHARPRTNVVIRRVPQVDDTQGGIGAEAFAELLQVKEAVTFCWHNHGRAQASLGQLACHVIIHACWERLQAVEQALKQGGEDPSA